MTDDEYRRFVEVDYDPRYPRSPWPALLWALLAFIALMVIAGTFTPDARSQTITCVSPAAFQQRLRDAGMSQAFSGYADGKWLLVHTGRTGWTAALRSDSESADICVFLQGSGPYAIIIPKGDPS